MVFSIDGRSICPNHPPYIVAELSANHNGSIERAKKIIETAKQCGADAVKLQTYRPDTITLNCEKEDFKINGGLWDGRTLFDLYQEAHMPWEWHRPLFDHARKVGITIFSSPFDKTAVDLLEDLNSPAYKIASFEAVDLPLIQYVAGTGKPIIISTGMSTEKEIQEAIDAAKDGGCTQIAILRCVSGYPAPAKEYNLRTIPDMISRFSLVTGLSDHTTNNAVAVASVALGAQIIEKHLTLDKFSGGPDDSFSADPVEFLELCNNVRLAWEALGNIEYSTQLSETKNIQFRRSLYFKSDLTAGENIGEQDICSVRPGYGLPPKYLNKVIGRTLRVDVSYGQPVRLEDLI